MASGEVHQTLGFIAGGLGAIGAYAAKTYLFSDSVSWLHIAGFASGLAVGILVTPDLDMEGATLEETRWKAIPVIGIVFYVAFRLAWTPYALMVKHRSPWSHFPIVGTLGRAVYVVLLLWLAQIVLDVRIIHLLNDYPSFTVTLLAGWALQDAIHWMAD